MPDAECRIEVRASLPRLLREKWILQKRDNWGGWIWQHLNKANLWKKNGSWAGCF
jgi:hypothetical protein